MLLNLQDLKHPKRERRPSLITPVLQREEHLDIHFCFTAKEEFIQLICFFALIKVSFSTEGNPHPSQACCSYRCSIARGEEMIS